MWDELYLNIMFFGFFIIMLVLSAKILLALNFERLFKQGRIVEIRVAFIIVCLIISYLTSKCIVDLADSIIYILKN